MACNDNICKCYCPTGGWIMTKMKSLDHWWIQLKEMLFCFHEVFSLTLDGSPDFIYRAYATETFQRKITPTSFSAGVI